MSLLSKIIFIVISALPAIILFKLLVPEATLLQNILASFVSAQLATIYMNS